MTEFTAFPIPRRIVDVNALDAAATSAAANAAIAAPVAGIVTEITTVAGIATDVTTVAGVAASVPTVAGLAPDFAAAVTAASDTAADRVQTGLDATATAADAVATAADRVQTGLDVIAAAADAVATAADRVQTGLDRVATGADAVQTGIDRGIVEGIASSSQLAGRNLIINGSGRINQRGYVSGAATSGANQFTLDRWFVITSGQNLTFTGNDSGRVMTAPAGGVSQVIEGANIVGGTYVLNWTGTATATVGGTARTKGETFTLTANTNVTVTFASGTFTDVQLERGSVVTPFEWRPVGQELALCQRYYADFAATSWRMAGTPSGGIGFWHHFPVYMRATPVITATGIVYNVNSSSLVFNDARAAGFRSEWNSGSGASHSVVSFGYRVDAELIA